MQVTRQCWIQFTPRPREVLFASPMASNDNLQHPRDFCFLKLPYKKLLGFSVPRSCQWSCPCHPTHMNMYIHIDIPTLCRNSWSTDQHEHHNYMHSSQKHEQCKYLHPADETASKWGSKLTIRSLTYTPANLSSSCKSLYAITCVILAKMTSWFPNN